jgi:glyoxylase-like metal-dependent hydrolase (beta-lactamase superfamily II)
MESSQAFSRDTLSRRSFVAAAGAACAAAYLARTTTAFAGDAEEGPVQIIRRTGPSAKISVQALRGDVSVLEGSGGNIAALDGPDGKLLVDAGVSKDNVLAALNGISAGPIRYLVNSHWHFDHTDGNAWLHAAGATIVGHENTRRHLSADTRVEGWDFSFAASPAGALPEVVFRSPTTLYFNGHTVVLEPYAPAHTDSDVRVTFPDADVVHVADTWWNGHYPFIDYSTGGSIAGTVRAAEQNVEAVTDKTIVIPGHGPVGDRKQLTEYRDMLRAVRDAVAALKKQGRSADEAVAAKPTARFDAKWGTFVIGPDAFTRLVYQGV